MDGGRNLELRCNNLKGKLLECEEGSSKKKQQYAEGEVDSENT